MPEGVGYGDQVVDTPRREEPVVDDSRQALVGALQESIRESRAYFRKPFNRMRDDMNLVFYGAAKQWTESGNYVANITQRYVRTKTSGLYAKNPTAVATRKPRMMYRFWDEDPATLMMAFQQVQMAEQGGFEPSPASVSVLQDFISGQERIKQLDKLGETLTILYDYFTDEGTPDFKAQMKSMVRRAITTGVGYVKLGFQRKMRLQPHIESRLRDLATYLARIERQLEEVGEGEITEGDAEFEQLKLEIRALESEPQEIIREGLVWDFPESTSIIPDKGCRELKGWVGADWVCRETLMHPNQVKEIYNVDLKAGDYTGYTGGGEPRQSGNPGGMNWRDANKQSTMAAVWEMEHKVHGLVYVMVDGYKDFLSEPTTPDIKLERFFTIFALTFNAVEHENMLFPPSDVTLMKPMQEEMNRSRQGLREHRIAARPKYAAPQGAFGEDDKAAIRSGKAHHLAELKAMAAGQKIGDLIQAWPTVGVDPNLYQTAHVSEDMSRVLGTPEAMLGTTTGATATESSIAAGSNVGTDSEQTDELDEFLSELARCGSQVLGQEMSMDSVIEIVGPGAVWPQASLDQIWREVFLEVKAGSSGRPNQQQEIANMERMAPFLLQVPGINPAWLAGEMVRRLDDKVNVGEAIMAGVPSMIAQNQMSRPGTGNPMTDPNQQGGQGGQQTALQGNTAPGPSEAQGAANILPFPA